MIAIEHRNIFFWQRKRSVMAPKIGRDNTVMMGSTANIIPTKNAEYPRCLAIVVKNGVNGAVPAKENYSVYYKTILQQS